MMTSTSRLLAAGLAIAMYTLLCIVVIYRQRQQRRATQRHATVLSTAAADSVAWLVCHASQTGNAEQLAWQTAQTLHTAGIKVKVRELSALSTSDWQACERMLLVVSTYGEGDAPDSAALFTRRVMNRSTPLTQLHYGLLALGDKQYRHFCGFGRSLHQWLQGCGAQALFAPIEVDNHQPQALQQWQHHLSHIAGTSDTGDWQQAVWETWRLVRRDHVNPGSAGGACFHLELEPTQGALPEWQSGDLVQVRAPADPDRPREYSIASIPANGRVHLLIRQEQHPDGSLGIASKWLTAQLNMGDTVDLRVRVHSNFRLGNNALRPLILIGNGTGIAGLRAHLKARALKHSENWLIFGERNATSDSYYRDELQAWQASGVLSRLDLVFSRDQTEREYVQDRLRSSADTVRDWLQQGAAIYVCGSLVGMASGVEAALTEILGAAEVERLIESGRYRRDVY